MKCSSLARRGVVVAILAAFSACGGGTVVEPSTATANVEYVGHVVSMNGRPVAAELPDLHEAHRYASILPDRPATRGTKTYEYIINQYGSYATIFDYPTSDKQIGAISNVGGQGCTNVRYGYGKKTFWIVAGQNQITEYQVPKKVIKTLSTPGLAPSSCAMNSNGDLAVGILGGYPNGGGDVVIFKGASGTGRIISNTPLIAEYFDGYDDKGNLFADGHDSRIYFALVELPKGGDTFERISTSDSIKLPGSVQWDGKYLTVLDQNTNIIHRYDVVGRRAVLKGTVLLTGVECSQTWIATGVIYCADGLNDDGAVFNYPAGGLAIATLTGNFDLPLGTVAVQK